MDNIDRNILNILNSNSRLTNKEIGKMFHMTGQAVGNRIMKLHSGGMIEQFSIVVNYPKTQYIRIFMDSNDYFQFEKYVNTYEEVEKFHKVSGQACYMIISHFTESNFSNFIESLSMWGRYSVETVVSDKKNR